MQGYSAEDNDNGPGMVDTKEWRQAWPLLACDLVRGFGLPVSVNPGSMGFEALVTKVSTSYASAIGQN